jgi:hypothetical protein
MVLGLVAASLKFWIASLRLEERLTRVRAS